MGQMQKKLSTAAVQLNIFKNRRLDKNPGAFYLSQKTLKGKQHRSCKKANCTEAIEKGKKEQKK